MLILPFMKPIENSNLKDWSFIRRINGQIRLKWKKWIIWRIRNEKPNLPRTFAQEIAKKLRNNEESVAKKQTEPDSWELMNYLCNRKGILLLWVSSWLNIHGFAEQSEFLDLTILRQRAALEHPTFPANPWIFRVPEVRFAAIRDCRSIHGIPWVLQETFLKAYLLEKDLPQLPSRIDGIWHHLLVDWTSEILWNMEEE